MSQLEKCDRRSLRSQRALRQALASELAESGDLSRINVASLTERAGLTRRTFYSHYRDIPDFINQIEDFIKRIIDTAREAVVPRAQTGILGLALGTFFDYYVTYVVSAEVGLIQRWFERGLTESPEAMARIMTVIAFVRPGDLYGQPIDINVPEYGLKLLNLQLEDAADTVATVESNN